MEFPVLLRNLFDIGINSKTWRILYSWYTDCQSSVRLGRHESHSYTMERGVRQGSILSPLLFLLVMDPLLRQLQSSSVGTSINNMYAGGYIHADDIRTLAGNVTSLESQISTVDHVHITAHPSFLTVGTLQNDVIRKAILDQFISIEFWEPWLNETDNCHGHSQMLAYQNCAYRFRGTYDYLMMCDTDDFFVPRATNQPKFKYYNIKKWCQYGACRFHWVERYPDCGIDKEKITSDGNITKALKSNTAKRLTDNKSLYKSSIILDMGIHMPMEHMSGYSVIHVPSNVAYFAHAHEPEGEVTAARFHTMRMRSIYLRALTILPQSIYIMLVNQLLFG